MANANYLLVANNLVDRAKNRLNTKRDPKQQETDQLFYWILSRLEWKMEGYFPAKNSISVTIREEGYCGNAILLKHGNVANYASTYVNGEEFYSVMKEVAEIFNEMSHFRATWIPHEEDEEAEMTVYMIARNQK